MKISKRKSEHIKTCLKENVSFKEKKTGFEDYEFIHCALPEVDMEQIKTETEFLGKTLSFPFMISAMTGGCDKAFEINERLAEVCSIERIAMGVGSQRQMMENERYLDTFRIVRERAPDGVIIGNIGAVEVLEISDVSVFQKMVDLIEADAMAVHLNPLQEILQPEGNCRFRGVLKAIERLVKGLSVPIIVKEVGCGISRSVAKRLVGIGVKYIDVAGAGGTSWAAIESYRGAYRRLAHTFWDWGIPTARSLEMVGRIKGVRVIASGGIKDGVVLAKAIALGAEIGGAARKVLKVLLEDGEESLVSLIRLWRTQLKVAMFLTGSSSLQDLRREGVIEKR